MVLLGGCFLFNQAPLAVIVATPLSGESPLVVRFDASQSSDPEGEDLNVRWDFGGGETSTAEIVDHTFLAVTETTTYTVRLRVSDPSGASATATQTIEVHPQEDSGGPAGTPTAHIEADRIIGRTPLTVNFDGRASEAGSGTLAQLRWDFGDGGSTTGFEVTHTFNAERTTTYRVTLMVWNSDGVLDSEQIEIIVIVPGDDAGDEEPVAELDVSEPLLLYDSPTPASVPTLYEVTFDPRGSYADAGHWIEYYVWEFGDGEWRVETTDLQVVHVYELSAPVHTYVVRFSVFDDQGLEGTQLVNLTLEQPEEED
ncbi:MAG: PKD domain-containing protein [Candidatus Bipolaricaulota bacterium]